MSLLMELNLAEIISSVVFFSAAYQLMHDLWSHMILWESHDPLTVFLNKDF